MIASKLQVQISLSSLRHAQLVELYRSAVADLRAALLTGDRAAKWRTVVLACDAEHELIGDCEGPCGDIYERLGAHDCYEIPEDGSGIPCKNFGESEFCRSGCALNERKKPRTA